VLSAGLFDAEGAAGAEAEGEDVLVCTPPLDKGEGPDEEEERVDRGISIGGGGGGEEGEEEAEERGEDESLCV